MLIHFLLAFTASILIFFLFNSLFLALICFASAILQDLDHIFEFWFAKGFNLNPVDFWKSTLSNHNYFKETGKVHIFFHSWEYILLALILGGITNNLKLSISFSLGYGLHLLWDQLSFGKHILSYSLLYRIKQKFTLEELVEKKI